MADPNISQSEIDNIEKEVNAKLAKEAIKSNDELAKKIREDVEKEYKQKAEIDELKAQQKKMQEEVEKAKAEAIKAKEDADKNARELQESVKKQMEEMMAQKRGITLGNQSPFQSSQPTGPTVRKLPDGTVRDVANLTPAEHAAIEEESRQKFMDFLGIRAEDARKDWGVDPRQK